MPKIGQMLESKFMKQEDAGDGGVLLTIKAVTQHNVAKQGAEPEHKWCLEFQESDKPMVLNSVNIQLCGVIFDSDDTDDWTGRKIVVYVDPTVMYQGKVTGGLRVRKPKGGSATAPARPKAKPAPMVKEDLDDDSIPF